MNKCNVNVPHNL